VRPRRLPRTRFYGLIVLAALRSKLGRSRAKTEDTFYRIAWHEWDRHIVVATTKTVEIVDWAVSLKCTLGFNTRLTGRSVPCLDRHDPPSH
jgi:hypothetical protein